MKRSWYVLLLVIALVAIPAFAQHESHGKQGGTEASAPESCPRVEALQKHHQHMEHMLAELDRSLDKVRSAADTGQRDAALTEHAKLLAEFRHHLDQQKSVFNQEPKVAAEASGDKGCMKKKSSSHAGH
ncbi:MAG: hypothetical protein ACE14L_15920 [Terriglobales bacterium]